jgi:predicted RNase H-like HicB family nuclease
MSATHGWRELHKKEESVDYETNDVTTEGTVQYAEPANAKTDYEVTVTVTGNNIKTVRRQLESMFPGNNSVHVCKVENCLSRAERLSEASAKIEIGASEIGELREELEDWRDNLPENLQSSSKSEALEEVISSLQEAEDDIQNVIDSCSGIEFPGMY